MPATDSHAQAVIFDLDGVIVDSEPLHVEAWKVLFARDGIRVTDEEHRHGVGMLDADWIRYLFARRGQTTDPERWQDAKRAVYRDILARNIRPFPGVVELVRRLRAAGFRLAVASSSWRENIDAVLGGTSLTHCFDVLTGKDDVDRAKPDPEPYLLTAQRLGIPPAACTVVEDSVLGLQAAKRAGMRCIAVTNSLGADQLAAADLIVATLEDPEPVLCFLLDATDSKDG